MRATEISSGTDKSQSVTINTEMTFAVTSQRQNKALLFCKCVWKLEMIPQQDGNWFEKRPIKEIEHGVRGFGQPMARQQLLY